MGEKKMSKDKSFISKKKKMKVYITLTRLKGEHIISTPYLFSMASRVRFLSEDHKENQTENSTAMKS